MSKWKEKNLLPNFMQYFLNATLFLLALLLIFLLGYELFSLIEMLFNKNYDYHDIFAHILTFFLYFEFVAMIVKYFEEDYHFPLRYFMYIGITATIRLIIVNHEDGLQTLYFTGAIFLLVLSYAVLNLLTLMRNKLNIENNKSK